MTSIIIEDIELVIKVEQTGSLNLAAGEQVNIKFTLRVPLQKVTRLVVQIVDDGYAVETSYSQRFKTG